MFSSSKQSVTLLILTPTEVMRADMKGGKTPAIKSFAKAERPARTPIAAAAELAVSLIDAKPSSHTILLAEDLWSGIVDLDDRSIYGLEGDELNQMLRFETESQSDLDPMTGHLGCIELSPVPPDTRRFWCTAISSDELMGVATAISLRGGKLAFCAHPIGLASPEMIGVPWIEFSETLAGAFALGGDGLPRASISTRSKTSDRWYQALEVNFGSELPEEGWLMPGAKPPSAYSGALQSLEVEETLQRWITSVASRLTRPDTLPVVAPIVPEASAQTLTRVGAAAVFLVAAACGSHYAWSKWTESSIEQQIAKLKEPAEEQRKLNEDLTKLNTQITELESELDEVEVQQAELALITARSDRFSALLEYIAAGRDENLVVDEISVNTTGLQLAGRAIRSDAATNLAMHLTPRVAEIGWKVEAPSMQGSNKLVNGGPWAFTINLVDTVPQVQADEDSGAAVARSE